MIPRAVAAALADEWTTVTLAYVDAEGAPQACAVFYAWDAAEDRLLFLSSVTTRHGAALDGARAAFTAQAEGQDWRTIRGLQGSGRVRRLAADERVAAWPVYAARFPFASADALSAALARADLWELRVDSLRLIDNGVSFGHRTEWQRS